MRTLAVIALAACAVSGCGGDSLTEPEPVTLSDLFGTQLYRADGSSVSVTALNGVPVIGMYFASRTCPACGAFTPLLVDAYDQLRGEGSSFEVVLVTGGGSNATLFDYMADAGMSWLAISPLSDKVGALLARYNIQWVPTLVIIDGAANTVSMNGRGELTQSGSAAYDAWLAASSGSG